MADFGNAEPLRILHLLQNGAGFGMAVHKLLCESAKRSVEDVVAEDDGQRIVARKRPSQAERVGNAQGSPLIAVSQLHVEVGSVMEQFQNVAH